MAKAEIGEHVYLIIDKAEGREKKSLSASQRKAVIHKDDFNTRVRKDVTLWPDVIKKS